MDKPTIAFSKTLLLIATLLGTAGTSYAQFEESVVDSSSIVGRTNQSGGYFNRQFGTALRFNYQTEGYGVQKGIVTLGSMKVINLDSATLNFDAQATLSDDFGAGYNAGIFYRSLRNMGFGPDPERILGVGFWSDGQSTSADNFFNQLGVTLESLGESYDLRVQGNFPLERREDGDLSEVVGADPVYVENFLMSDVFQFQRDTSLTNVDFEFAKRLTDDLEAWAYLAGYQLSGGPYDTTGYRAGVRGYAVPDLLLSLQVTDDDIYHTNVMFQLTWFVGRTNAANAPCGNIIDRFRDPVQRNAFIATVQETLTDAVNPYTDAVTGEEFFFVHVDDDTPAGTGDGTAENPYSSLAEAEAGSSEDNIILVHSETTIDDVQFTAKDGQLIYGEGLDPNGNQVDHIINTTQDGLVVLPETATGAKDLMRPIINGVLGSGDPNNPNAIFELANDNELNNFDIIGNGGGSDIAVNANAVNAPELGNLDIDGPFEYGVVFTEVTGNALIENSVTIDGTTSIGMHIDGGSSNVGANATVTNSAGRSVQIENRQGGTLTVGEINDTGDGILVQENDAGDITFSSLATVDTVDSAVTLLNNQGASITFQELVASSTAGDTFFVQGGGNITVNDTQGDGSTITNTGIGSTLEVEGDDGTGHDGNATINIAGDLLNTGGGYVVDVQNMTGGGVTVSGSVEDPNQDGLGILVQDNSAGIYNFTGATRLNTGDNRAVSLINNDGASIAFTDLQAEANDADTFVVIGGGLVTVTDPNGEGNITNTGTGSALVVLGDDDPNAIANGNPTVSITPDINNSGGGYAVDVQHLTGGSVTTNGTITDTDTQGMGIRAWENSDATIDFNGLSDLSTGTNTAVSLRNNSDSTINFGNLMATSTDADTFEVWGGGTITVNDPNDDGFITNTGTGDALVVLGADDANAVGNPTLTVNTDVNNSGGGYAVDVRDLTGGSVDINGDVSDPNADGMGIRALDNENATISFDGLTNLDTGNATAVLLRNNDGSTISFNDLRATAADADTFVVIGAGTVNVADPNGDRFIENTGTGSALVVKGDTDLNASGDPNVSIAVDVNNSVAGRVVDIQDMTAGSVTVTGDVNDNDPNDNSEGILIQDNSGGSFSFAGTTDLNTGDNNALTMIDNEGSTTTFNTLEATAAAGNTVDIQGGGIITLGDPNSTSFIENTGAGTALMVLGNVNGDPNLVVNADITNSVGGRSVDIQSMNANGVSINGTVDDTGDGVLVQNNAADATIQFSDTVTVNTSTGDAVALVNNTGADISFNGLDLTVEGGGKGFSATGGGNLTVLNTNATEIDQNGDAAALELENMTIGAAGAEFDVVNFGDPNTASTSDAIILRNLDGTGQVVVGSGADPNEGGQITTDGTAIVVDNVNNLAVNNIRIANTTGDGIDVTGQQAGSSASFTGMDIDTTTGTGISVNDNTAGTVAFTDVTVDASDAGGGNAVVNSSNGTASVSYTELDASAVGGDTFTIEGGGSVTVSNTSEITNTGTGSALVVTGADGPGTGNPTAVIGGEIENSGGGRSVDISDMTAGSVSVSANVDDDSLGILIEDNTGGTIAFSGDVLLNTGTDDALTIQNNGVNNSVTFEAASRLDIDTTDGTGVVVQNSGAVSILGSGNTIDNTGLGIGVDIDDSSSVTIANTTINTAVASAIDIDHTTDEMDVTLNDVTINTSGGTAVDILANSTDELDVVIDSINVDVGDVDGIALDTGANAGRVDLSITGDSLVSVGDASAFRATLDDSDTAGVRLLVQGDGVVEQEFRNNSGTDAAFDVQISSGMNVNATIGQGPGVDPNDPTEVPPPATPGDNNRFRNQGAGDAFVFNNGGTGTANLDLRDNEAISGGGAEFDLISGVGGTFNLVDRDDTIAGDNNQGTVTTTGTFNDIDPPLQQPTP